MATKVAYDTEDLVPTWRANLLEAADYKELSLHMPSALMDYITHRSRDDVDYYDNDKLQTWENDWLIYSLDVNPLRIL